MSQARILVAGTHSGVGKTIVATGIRPDVSFRGDGPDRTQSGWLDDLAGDKSRHCFSIGTGRGRDCGRGSDGVVRRQGRIVASGMTAEIWQVAGYLPRDSSLAIPERRLGLHLAQEAMTVALEGE